MNDTVYDDRFAELARGLRFATDEDLAAARKSRDEQARDGRRSTLGETLVRLGTLSFAQHEAIDRRLQLQPEAGIPASRPAPPPVPPCRSAAPREPVPAPLAYGLVGGVALAALAAGLVTSGTFRTGGPGVVPPAAAVRTPDETRPADTAARPAAAPEAPREAAYRMESPPAPFVAIPPPSPMPPFPAPRPDGLVGYWALDDGSGMRAGDASGQGHDGTLRGRPAWTQGPVGGALAFDGTRDCVDTAFKTDLAQWTIACWVRSPEPPAKRSPSGPVHRERGLQISWDHPVARFRGAAGVCVRNEWHLASFGPLAADRWVHLAATYDGETLRAYADGALVTENDGPSGPPDPELFTLKIGAHAFGTAFFRGAVDDVRLYDRALDADAIRRLAGAK